MPVCMIFEGGSTVLSLAFVRVQKYYTQQCMVVLVVPSCEYLLCMYLICAVYSGLPVMGPSLLPDRSGHEL